MERLFPGRVVLGVGTGEAINEAPFVNRWPNWKEKTETLAEAVQLMKRYWSASDYFDFTGKYFKVKGVYCYDKPVTGIPIYWSAFGSKSAQLGGLYADHLMTSGSPEQFEGQRLSPISESRKKFWKGFDQGANMRLH